MITHEFRYRAGRSGFAAQELPDRAPGWHCPCGLGWTFTARAMPHRRTGNNEIEARRAYDRHVRAMP